MTGAVAPHTQRIRARGRIDPGVHASGVIRQFSIYKGVIMLTGAHSTDAWIIPPGAIQHRLGGHALVASPGTGPRPHHGRRALWS
jgi:hypothetical protein